MFDYPLFGAKSRLFNQDERKRWLILHVALPRSALSCLERSRAGGLALGLGSREFFRLVPLRAMHRHHHDLRHGPGKKHRGAQCRCLSVKHY